MDKKLITALLMLIVLSACANTKDDVPSKGEITVFKSPTCGCCVGWGSYMKDEGFGINTVPMADLSSIKLQHNIPANMESCHTAEVDGYFVEGHVPVEIIDKLLTERPDIDGIALPRMPAGSPGMPGSKTGEWTVYAIKDGQVTVYAKI